MAKRMYVAGSGKDLVYCVVASKQDAEMALGANFRSPDPDDLRVVWKMARLDEMSGAEIQATLGVSRQTVDNWWHKAGGEGVLLRRSEHIQLSRKQQMRELVKSNPHESPSKLAKKLNTSVAMVNKVAREVGVKLTPSRRRPTDEELIKLATDKTWQEFADAVGLRLSTLRTYVYARPELSQAIAQVRRRESSGHNAHGKIDVEKVKALRSKGYSAYRIAQELRVEPMSVRHWLKKMAQEESARDKARNARPPPDLMGSCFGGKYG